MSFSTQDSDEVLSEMNVTPLVDVMLVLLVVFIVTAPLMTNAIKVNLPKTDAVAPADKKDPVVVSVDQDGKFYLAKSEVAPESLEGQGPGGARAVAGRHRRQLRPGRQGHGVDRALGHHADFRDDFQMTRS
jgi:hypothetical protein